MAAQNIFVDWEQAHTEAWGQAPVKARHALHESPLFSLEAIADLIDAYPREHYSLIHMGPQGGRRFWREGELGGLKGRDVIDWIALHFNGDKKKMQALTRLAEVDQYG